MFNFIKSFRSKRSLSQFLRGLEAVGDRDLTPTDIVSLKEPLRSVLNGAVRAGRIKLDDLARDLGITGKDAASLAVVLVKRGMFHVVDATTYDVRVSGKTYGHENSRTMELWSKFDVKEAIDKKDKDKHQS